MKIELRTLQIPKTSWVNEPILEYEKKISFFSKFIFRQVKNEKDLLKSVDPKDFVLICDEQGKSFSSYEFSDQLSRILSSGKQFCHLIVGGPFGLPAEVKERANLSLSLSSFVMNQEVALLVAAEQLFRGFTILNNHPYHNE